MKFQNEINFKLHTCHSSIFYLKTLESPRVLQAQRLQEVQQTKKTSLERLHCRCFSKVDNNRGVLAVSNDDGLYLRLCHHPSIVWWFGKGYHVLKDDSIYVLCIYMY